MEGIGKEPLLISKGEPNLLWRQWYAKQVRITVEQARKVQCERISDMPEPSLKAPSGLPSANWCLWWRIKHNVSKNIALRICKAKIDGTYVEAKRQQRDVDRYLRKLDREEDSRTFDMRSARFQYKPYVIIGEEKVYIDGRLGSGEVNIVRLCGSKLGVKELTRIQNLNEACANAVHAAYIQHEQKQ
jgi:hypothetical protein